MPLRSGASPRALHASAAATGRTPERSQLTRERRIGSAITEANAASVRVRSHLSLYIGKIGK